MWSAEQLAHWWGPVAPSATAVALLSISLGLLIIHVFIRRTMAASTTAVAAPCAHGPRQHGAAPRSPCVAAPCAAAGQEDVIDSGLQREDVSGRLGTATDDELPPLAACSPADHDEPLSSITSLTSDGLAPDATLTHPGAPLLQPAARFGVPASGADVLLEGDGLLVLQLPDEDQVLTRRQLSNVRVHPCHDGDADEDVHVSVHPSASTSALLVGGASRPGAVAMTPTIVAGRHRTSSLSTSSPPATSPGGPSAAALASLPAQRAEHAGAGEGGHAAAAAAARALRPLAANSAGAVFGGGGGGAAATPRRLHHTNSADDGGSGGGGSPCASASASASASDLLLATAPCMEEGLGEGLSQELDNMLRTSAPASAPLPSHAGPGADVPTSITRNAAEPVLTPAPRGSTVPTPPPQQQQQQQPLSLAAAAAAACGLGASGRSAAGPVVTPAMLLGEFVAARGPVQLGGALDPLQGPGKALSASDAVVLEGAAAAAAAAPRHALPGSIAYRAAAGEGGGGAAGAQRELRGGAALAGRGEEQQQRECAAAGGAAGRCGGAGCCAWPSAPAAAGASPGEAVDGPPAPRATAAGAPPPPGAAVGQALARRPPARPPRPPPLPTIPQLVRYKSSLRRPAVKVGLGPSPLRPGACARLGLALAMLSRCGACRSTPGPATATSLRCARPQVCIKLQTEQGLSAVPTDVALQLQGCLRNM